MSRYLERLSEDTVLCWSQGRNRASKCVTEEMTRLRRLCVFCWRQLIGSRNKTNLQPVKLIASSNSTRTRGVWGLSWGRGKRCSRVCPPPPPTTSTPHLATIITLDIWAELHIDLMDRLRWMLSVYKTVFYFYSQQMSYLY